MDFETHEIPSDDLFLVIKSCDLTRLELGNTKILMEHRTKSHDAMPDKSIEDQETRSSRDAPLRLGHEADPCQTPPAALGLVILPNHEPRFTANPEDRLALH